MACRKEHRTVEASCGRRVAIDEAAPAKSAQLKGGRKAKRRGGVVRSRLGLRWRGARRHRGSMYDMHLDASFAVDVEIDGIPVADEEKPGVAIFALTVLI